MIIEILLDFVFGIFTGLTSLLPVFDGMEVFTSPVADAFSAVNYFVDIVAVFAAIGSVLALFMAVQIFHLVVWVLSKIRVLG